MSKAIKFDYLSKHKSEYAMRYRFWIKIIKNILKEKDAKFDNILDIGCQYGIFKNMLGEELDRKIIGVDPNKELVNHERDVFYGFCHKIPFDDNHFDFITLISVFEHIQPSLREESILEIKRVMKKGGILFVQMPNPKFPLEFHSRVPFFGYLPETTQNEILKMQRKKRTFWSIDMKAFTELALKNGFELMKHEFYNYPKEVVPKLFRPFYFITRIFPMGVYSLYVKK